MGIRRPLLPVTMAALVGSGCGGRVYRGSHAASTSGETISGGVPASSDAGSESGVDFMPGVDAEAYCRVPTIDAGNLPFVVDTAFVPSGWMGDAPAYAAIPANAALGTSANPGTSARMSIVPSGYSMIGDACSPEGIGRSSPDAKGGCWKVTYVPFPRALKPDGPGSMTIGGGPGYGWAGAFWQYRANNWGALGGGYPIPPGATQVSFWARGQVGGELVLFFTGEGLGLPCSDYAKTRYPAGGGNYGISLASPPAWQNFTIDISDLDYSAAGVAPSQGPGGYFGGVIGAFGFTVADQTLPSAGPCPAALICAAFGGPSAPPNDSDPDGGLVADPATGQLFPPFFPSTITFYVDDIEFR
jgi:hypothetical protein